MLRGKFIAWNTYITEEERSKINILSLYLKGVEKERPTKPKARKVKEQIKIRTEINEMNNRKIELMKQIVGSLKRSTKLTNL
jgi:preprotein translocase subunit SecB